MGGLREILVMVDTEDAGRLGRRDSADGWGEEARIDVRQNDERRQTVEIRNGSANGEAGNLRIVPFDRKEDGRGSRRH